METIVNTILENEIKLNCITMDFCNELGEDSESDPDSDSKSKKSEEGEDSDSEGKQTKKLKNLKEETELQKATKEILY